MTTAEAVQRYIKEGWSVIPIPKGEKGPRAPQWQTRTFDLSDFGTDDNIGVKLGTDSHDLVDVDLDSKEAVAAAAELLLATGRIHGRPSKPQSHYWYYATEVKSEQFKDTDGSVLVEIRSTGGQTVLPPSQHPSGETLSWEIDRDPNTVDGTGLRETVRLVAVAAILARHWPAGSRHFCSGYAGGFLAGQGLDPATVEQVIRVVAQIANDPEVEDRALFARETALKLAGGQPVTGAPKLAELIGDDVVRKLRAWFGKEASDQAFEELEELNNKYCIVRAGESVVVLDETVEDQVLLMQFAEFKKLYLHRNVITGEDKKGKPQVEKLADWWLQHPKARRHQFLETAPPPIELSRTDNYNLWHGWRVDPKPGTWSLFKQHIVEIICAGNANHADYLFNWLAALTQAPGILPEVAVVMRGGRGAGKGMFARTVGELLHRRHFAHVASRRHLTGNFNALLEGRIVVYADEAVWAGDKNEEGVLKTLITEPTLVIEHKGINSYVTPNFTHLIMASNNGWVVPSGMDERRFFVVDVSNERQRDTAYFNTLMKELNQGGKAAMFYDLMQAPVDWDYLRNAPNTEALWRQKLRSMSADERWWYTRLASGNITGAIDGWPKEVKRTELHADYQNAMEKAGVGRRMMEMELFYFLKEAMPAGHPIPGRRRGGSRTWEIPPLRACRKRFCERFKLDVWPGDDMEQATLEEDDDVPF